MPAREFSALHSSEYTYPLSIQPNLWLDRRIYSGSCIRQLWEIQPNGILFRNVRAHRPLQPIALLRFVRSLEYAVFYHSFIHTTPRDNAHSWTSTVRPRLLVTGSRIFSSGFQTPSRTR